DRARGEGSLLQQPRNDEPLVFFARSTSYWPIAHIESGASPIATARRSLRGGFLRTCSVWQGGQMRISKTQDLRQSAFSVHLTSDMKRVINEQRLAFVATVCPDGTPNLSPKGTIASFDDEQLVFVDIRSPGTIRNLEKNPSTEINVVDQFCRKGYRFKGTGQVVRDGALFQELEKFYAENWVDVGKGRKSIEIRAFVLIDVRQALPLISPSYDSGATEEEIHQEWTQYFLLLRVGVCPAFASESKGSFRIVVPQLIRRARTRVLQEGADSARSRLCLAFVSFRRIRPSNWSSAPSVCDLTTRTSMTIRTSKVLVSSDGWLGFHRRILCNARAVRNSRAWLMRAPSIKVVR